MTRSPVTIAFHAGAHKTATTHLQTTIKRAGDPLAAEGVRFYGPEHFRLPGRNLPALFGFHPRNPTDGSARSPQENLAALLRDGHRLVISEENFIGALNSAAGRGLRNRYRPAPDRLAKLAAGLGHPVEVFLAIRRPTNFTNSAYCQMLLGGHVKPVGVYLRRNPLSGVDWPDLVARIRATKGIGAVTVWRYEDYAALFPRILCAMLGEGPARHVPRVDRPINAGLSAPAVAEVLHRAAAEVTPGLARQLRGLLPVEEGYPPFDAFTPEEHAMSDAHYAEQVMQIAAMPGVTFLRPDRAK